MEFKMNNKIIFVALNTLLISLLPLSTYAYIIGSDLIIDNQTEKNLVVTIPQPDSRYPIQKEIPAKKEVTIYLENGDSTGLLYQAKTKPFSIKEAGTEIEQVNGRIAFYVGASVWNKYSFLDSVLSSPSIQVTQYYSCDNGGSDNKFQNKLVISGNPDGASAPVKLDNNYIDCRNKLESSSKPTPANYVGICTNNQKVLFDYDPIPYYSHMEGRHCHWVVKGHIIHIPVYCDLSIEYKKEFFDKLVERKSYCYGWRMNL